MPEVITSLTFSERHYDHSFNQSILSLNATDSKDKYFQFQFRGCQEKSKKIDFEKLKVYLETNTTSLLTTKKRILHYPGYNSEKIDNIARAQKLFQLFPDIQHAEFLYNKILYRKNGDKIEELKNKNLIHFFKLDSFQEDTIQFGYEISQANTKDIIPNCCIYFIEQKALIKKIYLNPYSTLSLENLLTEKAMKEFPANADTLKILFYEEKIQENNPNRDIYLRLQGFIREALTHLEKSLAFRKADTDKIAIFIALSKMISNKESLDKISNELDSYNKIETLSKHRDLWQFLNFFKGETYSVFIWKELIKQVQSTETRLSHQPR